MSVIDKGELEMENGWVEAIFNNHISLLNEKVSSEFVTKDNYVSTDNMIPNRGGIENVKSFPKQTKFNSFKEGDVLFSNIRTYFKKVWKANFSGGCSNDVLIFRSLDENFLTQDFLYYLISNENFIQHTVYTAKGTKMPRGDKDAIKKYQFNLPPLPQQKQIATILSTLDQKIALLKKQNQTLEELAQTLFKRWFVESIDDNWEETSLSNIADIGIGRTPPRKEDEWFTTNKEDVKWISIKDMGECGVYVSNTSEYLTKKAVEKFHIPVIPVNTVVLSFKMTLGRVSITTEEMLSNEAIAHFKIKDEKVITPEFLYFFLKTYRYQKLGSTSSIVTSINSGMIKDMDILIPDEKEMSRFQFASKAMFNTIKNNSKEIQTLTQLRDTLLPKLMSGSLEILSACNAQADKKEKVSHV